MNIQSTDIEYLLKQLNPKYLRDVKTYLEYLLYTQQKDTIQPPLSGKKPDRKDVIKERLESFQAFKGDALFPDVVISKYDVYEQ